MTDRRTTGTGGSAARPYDDLLTQVLNTAVDHDYAAVAQRRGGPSGPRRNTAAFVAVVAGFGLMVGVSALKTEQDRPAQIAERAQLVDQIHGRQARLDALHAQLTLLQEDVTTRQGQAAEQAAVVQELTERVTTLGVAAGTVAVDGPGLSVTVDDAQGSGSGLGGVVLDSDLQLLVNGLWEAGAEGIAIDGNRLSSLTSIRFAGRAITVDYRSLTPPYVVDVVGNPDNLPARLLETEAGKVWLGLKANFGIRFDIQTSENVTLPADPHDHLLYARRAGGRR